MYGNKKHKVTDGFMSKSKNLDSIFPSPAVLESYEEVKPGTVDRMIKMVEREQKHRHNLEMAHAKVQPFARVLGKLTTLIAIIYFVMSLFAISAEHDLPWYFMLAAAALFIVISWVRIKMCSDSGQKASKDGQKRKTHHNNRGGNFGSNKNSNSRGSSRNNSGQKQQQNSQQQRKSSSDNKGGRKRVR